ncbi:hypothetical protein OQA88_2416 [Cercophora sp. LCS_1]
MNNDAQTTRWVAAAVLVAGWFLFGVLAKSFLKKTPKLDIPHVDFADGGKRTMERYAQEGNSLLIRGYHEYSKKGLPFSVFNSTNTSRPLVVLPTKYLEEVRNAGATKLSFNEFLNKSQISADIGAPLITDRTIHVVRQDLNKSLSESAYPDKVPYGAQTNMEQDDLIQPLHQVCAKVVPRLIPPSKDWTPHNGFMLLFQLSSRLMARVIVGPELWDDDDWHQACNLYFHAGMIATNRVRNGYPSWLRWTSRFLDKYVMAIHMARRKGKAILKPIVEACQAQFKESTKETKHRLGDGVSWLVESYLASGKSSVSPGDIMQDASFLLAASVPSTTSTALSILMDLVDVDHANMLAEIRDEISTVYAEHGNCWTRRALGALQRLDDFMKESQRMHNLQYNTMQRLALQDYIFKDGLRIPAGTPLVMPSRLLGLDPDLHPAPEQFDPSRWKRMREQHGDATKFHFASVHDDMLPWGSGPHACPGRFLAQHMIKLILIHFVTRYDIKHGEGDGHRPPDMPDHGTEAPNMGAMLLFKER